MQGTSFVFPVQWFDVSKPLVLYLCVCAHVHTGMCRHVPVCMLPTREGQRSTSGVIPLEDSFLFFETTSLNRTWCFPMKLGCQTPEMSPPPQCWDHKCMPSYLVFHYGCWGLNLGPHAFSTSTLPAELLLRPSVRYVSDIFCIFYR